MGASDHAIALFYIGYGRVLGFLYVDTFTLHFVVNYAHYYMFYICGCDAQFVINSLFM